ncbi:MAG: hypothetical protein RLP44_11305 [Aggregatilineales bacterium]
MQGQNNSARRTAYTMIFIWMIGAGVATSFSLGGNTRFGLIICGASIFLSLVVMVIGGFTVAASSTDEE